MKILKIELQNINSLKSDTPIVIDFENDTFKDVGLYAITGSTGAGKTTILDAITIALYHNVPRFNGTKGTLIDVVSHRAHNAFSNITFKNDNIIYEAYWGIKVADKSGKKYKNPQEEVRLKNLSTGVILATQKRILISEVHRVTQLDYHQFLRSVMLAQGEFASFLSAKGPEKGKLLEQITGEQIYKKIGEGILNRKSNEEKKLEEIKSKINADDILTEEKKNDLTQKDKVFDSEINKTEKALKSTQFIVDWYLNFKKLADASEKLEKDAQTIAVFIDKHKTELTLLEFNEKAAPFKELLQNLNRTEKNSIEKLAQLKILESDLALLKPAIENLENLTKNKESESKIADNYFNAWLPKFDLITQLDGQLINEGDNKKKSTQKLAEVTQQIESLKNGQKTLTKELIDTTTNIKNGEVFILQNSFLKEVDSEISSWTSALTTLKGNKETLNETSLSVIQKKKEVENSNSELTENTKHLTKKSKEIEDIEKGITVINQQLSKNNLTNLLTEEKKLSLTESNWKQFKNFSEERAKDKKELEKISIQKNSFSTDLKGGKKELETVKKQILSQEAALADAEKILNLEKSIAKYEDDRQHLLQGQPCGLCGSEEHPFADNLVSVGVSKSELELNIRKGKLKSINDYKSELDKNEATFSAHIHRLTQQINAINIRLKSIQSKAKNLDIDCELSNLTKINLALSAASTQLKLLDSKIKATQKLQTKKDHLSENAKDQNKSIELLKTKDARLSEKIKNALEEIDTKQKLILKLTKTCIDLETDLTSKFSKFNYKLPSIEHTYLFISELEGLIVNFNKKQKKLDALKATITVINSNLSNHEKQLVTQVKNQLEYTKNIRVSDSESVHLKTKRMAILPINISVETKRNSLQFAKKQLAEKLVFSKKELQKQLDAKTEKEALKLKNNKDQKELFEELHTLKSLFKAQIKDSNFESKQAIENALLNQEDVLKYTQNKERIKEVKLKLKTLEEANLKAIENLNTSKNFSISEAESKVTLESLKITNKDFLTEKGKIVEAFRKDQEIRDRNKEVYLKIDAQAKICGVWKELFRIIGNSKDAFNVYVQRLTLKHLLDLANVHLYKLNKRYSLKMEDSYKPKEELNFNLIDHYQTDQTRLVDTSSGGEKFIISLALALGLSDLASKNVKIESLFIDEGFGTLDNNTLETVISTLETLQLQGKLIGIISHVENLKERISTQIQITKKSNGISVVALL